MRTLLTVLCLCAIVVSRPTEAMVGLVSLEKLIATSDAIVVAQVVRVSGPPRHSGRERIATAQVLRSFKSPLDGSFRFLASPTWTCDLSDAVDGEVVLLFLNRRDASSFAIAHSGHGRMPLRRVAGKTYVTLFTNTVRLPPDAPTIPGPDPAVSLVVSVELPYVRALVATPNGTSSRGLTPACSGLASLATDARR